MNSCLGESIYKGYSNYTKYVDFCNDSSKFAQLKLLQYNYICIASN